LKNFVAQKVRIRLWVEHVFFTMWGFYCRKEKQDEQESVHSCVAEDE